MIMIYVKLVLNEWTVEKLTTYYVILYLTEVNEWRGMIYFIVMNKRSRIHDFIVANKVAVLR